MIRVILVSTAGSVEGVLVCDDDQVDDIMDQLRSANAGAEDPVDIKEYGSPDNLENVIGYIRSP